MRRDCSTRAYAGASYAVAAAVSWIAVAASHAQVRGLPARCYLAVLALAVGPQLIGHTTLNWALRDSPAARVAIVVSGEPILASLLAWACFAETPPAGLLVAAPLTALGIHIALSGRQEASPVGAPAA